MESKPHVVIIPFPSEEHVDPMLKFAKILHAKGFYITFVHSEYNYQRLLNTRGPSSLDGLPDFRFETFLDGIPSPEIDRTKDLPSLLGSVMQNGLPAIRDLVVGLNNNTNVPPITYIVSDNLMSFTLDVAKEINVPLSYFWATSACGLLGYLHVKDVVEKGLCPLKDEADLVNGYLETRLDWIPGMNNVRLKDMSSLIRTTDANDFKLNFVINESKTCYSAASIIINTFQELDSSVLEALSSLLPPVYEIGPLDLLYDKMIADKPSAIESMGANLSNEDPKCLEWLDTKAHGSVVYVYVECISMMTNQQLTELAWGLCNSNKDFLWINISPEDTRGDTVLFPEGFLEKTKERSMFSKWCSQNDVFNHPAIGGLVTNCYYNSISKSICGGVPMLCLPIFGEQKTNCRYSCVEWSVGLEIDSDVKRDEVTSLITELMDGEKGKDMRTNAKKLKARAIAATQKGGSSFTKMNNFVDDFQTMM